MERGWIFTSLLAITAAMHRPWRFLTPFACRLLAGLGLLFSFASASAAPKAAEKFHEQIQPLLKEYCYDCHGDGMEKGKVAFDKSSSEDELFAKRELWLSVIKNVRAGLMPPEKKPRPSDEQLKQLEQWVKREVFNIDPQDPDPGKVTLRRLNRAEYRNTIRDLMGHDFNVEEELPPDDTGYGFDSIGDVLTISPMLMEKYMQAAETIVGAAVPRVTRVAEQKVIAGNAFHPTEGKPADKHSFYKAVTLTNTFVAKQPGNYRLILDLEVLGQFESVPGRCEVALTVDNTELWKKEFGWENGKKFSFNFDRTWQPGEHPLRIELHPLVPSEKKTNSLDLRITALRVEGPAEEKYWVRPPNFDKFFTQDPPTAPAERRAYAHQVLKRFANRAYRRPVDPRTVERLMELAESAYSAPGKRFEDGIAQAMISVLASPRFLFRVEEPVETASNSRFTDVDDYALASRLSYFLWSTMPDEELFQLAEKKQLRQNVAKQLKRMLADNKSNALMKNFVGQWLQARDVDGIDINARAVLARDDGEEKELEELRKQFRQGQFRRPSQNLTKEEKAEQDKQREKRRKFFTARVELDRDLRKAMREETEMTFAHVVRENRSLLELLESDYTFLNEKLGKHYGITNIAGAEMRLVHLPKGSPRGGVLTHGSVLVVTSNPTRTSPVKRGLFVLDNILGVPPPPPPPDIPALEEAEKGIKDREPTLRETLEIHRNKPLCSSCHSRMDPLGLALENFNAMGMWREQERKQTLDVAGKLITGETFKDIRDLKHILATKRRLDFYRCLTEKMLTYALGRGLEYYDVETVDQIVDRLDRENGRFSALLDGIVESAPFQKSRNSSGANDSGSGVEKRADLKGTK
jgi:mono/diheme cytochrome c family protein